MKSIDDYKEEIYRCMRCGACTAVCPVYAVLAREPAVARGRLSLLREHLNGNLELTPRMRDYLDLCLGCRACTENCPPQVHTDRVIKAARARFAVTRGQPLVRHIMLRNVLNKPHRFSMVMDSLRLARNTGLSRLLPKVVKVRENLLPPLPGRTFSEMLPGMKMAKSEKKVGFFLSCMDNVIFPQVITAVVTVLEKHGYQVLIPAGTVCCGVAHQNYGDLEGARKLARHNIQAFSGVPVDLILTDCASCGSTLKSYGELLAGEPGEAEAHVFADKVRDINEFLSEILSPGDNPVNVIVTYHDPCHLARYQKVREAPRKVLACTPGVRLVEMGEADRCCGGGGTFNIFHYRLSMEILGRKLENAIRTGASVLATACPACRIQLAHGIRQRGLPMEVLHPVEVLARSYK